MKKLTLLMAGLMFVGFSFAGEGNKGCCKGKKEKCNKEAKAKCDKDKDKGCCKKDKEKKAA